MLMSVWIRGWCQGLIKIAAPVSAFLQRHSEVAAAAGAGAGRQECDEIKEALHKSRSGIASHSHDWLILLPANCECLPVSQ